MSDQAVVTVARLSDLEKPVWPVVIVFGLPPENWNFGRVPHQIVSIVDNLRLLSQIRPYESGKFMVYHVYPLSRMRLGWVLRHFKFIRALLDSQESTNQAGIHLLDAGLSQRAWILGNLASSRNELHVYVNGLNLIIPTKSIVKQSEKLAESLAEHMRKVNERNNGIPETIAPRIHEKRKSPNFISCCIPEKQKRDETDSRRRNPEQRIIESSRCSTHPRHQTRHDVTVGDIMMGLYNRSLLCVSNLALSDCSILANVIEWYKDPTGNDPRNDFRHKKGLETLYQHSQSRNLQEFLRKIVIKNNKTSYMF